ncbi:MAG: hypothetical protein JJV92_06865 [Desulfosarcina sp.]|nr:hypothetical protein [Desulfobacterales bacterium]
MQKCILKGSYTVTSDALVKMVAVHKRLQKAVTVDEEVKKLLFGNRRIYASE